MRNTKIFIIVLSAVAMLFASCRKEGEELLNPNARYANSYAQQFDAVWHGIDNCYVFWSRDNTDWDAIYETYKPKFEAFDAALETAIIQHKKKEEAVPDSVFIQTWIEVVGGLLDHHFALSVRNYSTGNKQTIGGSAREVKKRPGYKATDKTAQYNALANHEKLDKIYINNDNSVMRVALLNKSNGKKIAYFRLNGFNISNLFNGKSFTRGRQAFVPEASDNDAAFLRPLYYFYGANWVQRTYNTIVQGGNKDGWINDDNVEGIIFDVRGNGGGNAGELTPVLGAMTQHETHYGYSRTKEGLGRLEYSAWTPFILKTPEFHLKTAKPIVVLADANSASCAEITTQTIHSLPNGKFIGNRTCGATCPLLPGGFNVLLSGVFGNYDEYGYYCYTSNFDLVTTDYTSLEGKGVTPDYDVEYKGEDGKDEQLDAAIEYLETGTVSARFLSK